MVTTILFDFIEKTLLILCWFSEETHKKRLKANYYMYNSTKEKFTLSSVNDEAKNKPSIVIHAQTDLNNANSG